MKFSTFLEAIVPDYIYAIDLGNITVNSADEADELRRLYGNRDVVDTSLFVEETGEKSSSDDEVAEAMLRVYLSQDYENKDKCKNCIYFHKFKNLTSDGYKISNCCTYHIQNELADGITPGYDTFVTDADEDDLCEFFKRVKK